MNDKNKFISYLISKEVLLLNWKNDPDFIDIPYKDMYGKDKDIEWLIDLILDLVEEGLIYSYSDITKDRLLDKDKSIKLIIHWDKIIRGNKYFCTHDWKTTYLDRKEAFGLIVNKNLFYQELIENKYKQPASTIIGLDQYINLLLVDKKGLDENIKLEDVYASLILILRSIPFKSGKLFEPPTYFKFLSDIGAEVKNKKEKALLMEDISKTLDKNKVNQLAVRLSQDDLEI